MGLRSSMLCAVGFLLLSCSGTDTGNPITHGGYSDETETIVTGVIGDSLGQPVAQCSLWIRPIPTVSVRTPLARVQNVVDSPMVEELLVTDSSGTFLFQGMPSGDYVLHAVAGKLRAGLQAKLIVQSKHTTTWQDTLRLRPLTSLILPTPAAYSSSPITIPELGASFAATDTLRLLNIPEGTYTIGYTEDTLQWNLAPTPGFLPNGNPPTTQYLTADSTGSPDLIPFGNSPATSILWFTPYLGELTDLRDSNIYAFTKIDSLYWFQENLRYLATGSTANPSDPNANSNNSIYGRFYASSQLSSVCPEGWQPPSLEEWNSLFHASGGMLDAGRALKSPEGWIDSRPNSVGSNLFGMQLLPAGTLEYPMLGLKAVFWATSAEGAPPLYTIGFHVGEDKAVVEDALSPFGGFNVRCVRPVSKGL